MLQELNTTKGKIILGMMVAAVAARFIPHEPNFTPVGAIALFGGTFILNKKLAIIVPLAIMLVSDITMQIAAGNGFHSSMLFVYAAFIMIGSLGFVLRRRVQRQTIMVSSLVGSLIFFFVTNFGSWIAGHGTYPMNGEGLVQCYIAGIPFFKGTVLGDLFYNLALFGSYSLVKWKFPKLVVN